MYNTMLHMRYSIIYIILKQEVLNKELLKNHKEKIAKYFLKNVWSGNINLFYDLEKRTDLNKLSFNKSIPQELKNISRVFYMWSMSIDKEFLTKITKDDKEFLNEITSQERKS